MANALHGSLDASPEPARPIGNHYKPIHPRRRPPLRHRSLYTSIGGLAHRRDVYGHAALAGIEKGEKEGQSSTSIAPSQRKKAESSLPRGPVRAR